MIEMALELGIFIGVLACLAAVADWIDGAERRDARRRNRP